MSKAHRTPQPPGLFTTAASQPQTWSRLQMLAGVGLLAALVLLAYYPAIHGQFVLDDTWLLTNNPLIRASDGLLRFWNVLESHDAWPMTNTSFWLEWRLWGMNPTGYHLTNLLLHVIEACLIWAILEKLSVSGALLAALLFALHPVNVESVAWISQRKNLLALLFSLLSILFSFEAGAASPKAPRSSQSALDGWYWLSLLSFVLAMLSKGSAAVLPVILIGIVWWQRPLTQRDAWRAAPFFLISCLLVPLNMWLQARVIDPSLRPGMIERLLGAGAVVWFYLYKALLPINLVFVYPQWHIHPDRLSWWLPLFATVTVSVALWWFRSTVVRPLFLAWAYFCVALTPVLGFTDITFMEHSLVADHYQHVPLIGVVVLLAAAWSGGQRRLGVAGSRALLAVAVVVIATLAFLTRRQSALYVDSLTLYQATLEKNPESWMLRTNLCSVFADAQRFREAIPQCEYALRLKPDAANAHNNLGNALLGIGQIKPAIGHLEEASRLQPQAAEIHNSLGTALREAGRLQEAGEHYRAALQLQPDYAAAHDNWGIALAKGGRTQEAISQFEQALQIDPNSPKAHNNLGIALAQTGKLDEAIGQFQQALHLDPSLADAQNNLRTALAVKQKHDPSTN
ncbi:MAG: tetratricopeptide repeat protein [Deltaproteobacteria bacterium]|nr:tetratricopeptide repeat protein [Deltaproteobacteria bacterium]